MNESRVYDLPTRVFHWLFAFLFVVAFAIGNSVDDDSSLFSYHMLAGIVLFLLVIFRLIWGIIGTKYARFSGFSLNPRELLEYFKGVLTGTSRKWIGHNPASSWAAIMMMLFALGLGVTGYLMSNGEGGHDLKEVHELLANGFLIVVLLHIAGVVLHSLRHRDGIWKSMFSGQKSPALEQIPPVPTYATLGIVLLIATIGFSGYLVQNFDSKSRNVSIFGRLLHLGEAEEVDHKHGEKANHHGTKRKHRDNHDHD